MADDTQTQPVDKSLEWLNWTANSLGYTLSSEIAKKLLPLFRQNTALGMDFGSAFEQSVEQVLSYLKEESR